MKSLKYFIGLSSVSIVFLLTMMMFSNFNANDELFNEKRFAYTIEDFIENDYIVLDYENHFFNDQTHKRIKEFSNDVKNQKKASLNIVVMDFGMEGLYKKIINLYHEGETTHFQYAELSFEETALNRPLFQNKCTGGLEILDTEISRTYYLKNCVIDPNQQQHDKFKIYTEYKSVSYLGS